MQKKALEEFIKSQDELFVLLTTQLILTTIENCPGIVSNIEKSEFISIYEQACACDNMRDLDPEVLFRNFKLRLNLAKNLTRHLQNIELNTQSPEIHNQRSFRASMVQENAGDNPLWKQAVALNLRKSINHSNNLVKMSPNISENERIQLTKGAKQLALVLEIVKNENNPLILNKVANDPYTRDSIQKMRNSVKIISNIEYKMYAKMAFEKIHWKDLKPLAIRRQPQEEQVTPDFIYDALAFVHKGGYMKKLNYSTSGGRKQFFKVHEGKLIWADKESRIKKAKKNHSYFIEDIVEIRFGKTTSTFLKKKNQTLEPWLCFSIILKNRPFDFYAAEDTINKWYYGLAKLFEISRGSQRCDGLVFRPAQLLWIKLKMVIVELVKMKLHRKDQNKKLSFVRALNLYNKLNYITQVNK